MWAKEDPVNERAFWASIYPRLLPLQVTGPYGRCRAAAHLDDGFG
jgi:hypothetical protein